VLELDSLEPELELEPSLLLSSAPVLEVLLLDPSEPVSVAGGGGSLVSIGGSPVVPMTGGVPVLPVVLAATSVSVDGVAHSPMHTGSGPPHAGARDERSKAPKAATLLRFMCTKTSRRSRAGSAATARNRAADQRRMISSPSPISTPNGAVVTSVPRSPT
jgi:hypothetical protein